MSGFTKLDSSLTASSIWAEPDAVRIVWVTMLSMADKDGNVKASVPGLAHLARKTLPETEHALSVLLAPDPHSGRKDLEGRRISEIEGGWHLVTHAFYRESGMSEDTKRYWREKKASQRSKMSKTVKDKSKKSRSLASGYGTASGFVLPKVLETEAFRAAWEDWQKYRREIKKPLTPMSIKGQLAEFEQWGPERAIAAIRHTIRKGWQGLSEEDRPSRANGMQKPRQLSFEDRAKRKGVIQEELNAGFRSAKKDGNGRAIYSEKEKAERQKLEQEMESL